MRPLVAEPVQLVGPQGALEGKTSCTMAQVAQLPLLMLSRPNGIREEIERTCVSEGVKADVVAEINAPNLLIAAVRAGLGYTIRSEDRRVGNECVSTCRSRGSRYL